MPGWCGEVCVHAQPRHQAGRLQGQAAAAAGIGMPAGACTCCADGLVVRSLAAGGTAHASMALEFAQSRAQIVQNKSRLE